MRLARLPGFGFAAILAVSGGLLPGHLSAAVPFSPATLAVSPDGRQLYVGCATSNALLVVDTTTRTLGRTLPLPGPASGLALSADGSRLLVTSPSPESRVFVVNTADGHITDTLPAGHTALSPVLSRDGATLYVCSRFDNAITVLDLKARVVTARIPVSREPVSAALTPNGKWLLVANHLPAGPATAPVVSASVSLINPAARMVTKDIRLPNGSIDLREIRVSPDGKYAVVAHVLARFQVPTFRVERGWMVGNALTVIDLARRDVLNTVLLDEADRGAANPWALAWSADGRQLCVTHAGTHELSVIDWPALLAKLTRLRSNEARQSVANDFEFLFGIRHRVPLKLAGPRALAIAGPHAYVAGYFSDSLDIVNLETQSAIGNRQSAIPSGSISLNAVNPLPVTRLGEAAFNDATICRQGWLSCATCHGDDARTDGIDWDLPNDGIGNPKKARSLLYSHLTPPVMSLGVRATSAVAVRAGFRNSLFSLQPEEIPAAIDAWMASLEPVPSPHLVGGTLSPAAKRGEALFRSRKTGCADCHAGELLTDLGLYDVGTRGPFDRREDKFDTPTLREIWRTGPYLHDGSAATLREVITTRNPGDQHGSTSELTPAETEDLLAYLLAL